MKRALLPVFLVLLVLQAAPAEPSSHLATVPTPSAEEKEIIDLLQWQPAQIGNNGSRVNISVYNPTKYILNSCVARFTSSGKIQRVYFSDAASIPPFKDGFFGFATDLPANESLKYEILQITYRDPAKKAGKN